MALLFSTLGIFLGAATEMFTKTVVAGWEIFMALISGDFDKAREIADKWVEDIRGIFTDALADYQAVVDNWLKEMKKYIEPISGWFDEKVVQPFSNFLDSVNRAITDLINGVKRWISNQLSKLTPESPAGSGRGGGGAGARGDKYGYGDFIWRPGGRAQSFSPQDTIIGVKDPSKLFGKGMTFHIDNTIHATVSNNMDIEELAEELSRRTRDSLRRRMSYGV
jgi:hypothetical protein